MSAIYIADSSRSRGQLTISQEATPKEFSRSNPHWERESTARKLTAYENRPGDISQRQWALDNEVSRSTLQNWKKRKDRLEGSEEEVTFFESEPGLECLHRIVVALHVSFTKAGSASVRNIGDFLHRTGLDKYAASSVGYHHELSHQLDEQMMAYEAEEKQRLVEKMPEKTIALAEDETFHPKTCLVAIEPESNYIVAEKYVPKRDGCTWHKEVSRALAGLPVKVMQVISDEGKAIIHHAEKMLGVHRSSDLFHVGYEVVKAVSLSLRAAVNVAEKKYKRAMVKTPPSPDPSLRIEPDKNLAREQKQRTEEFQKAQSNAEDAKAGNSGIGKAYHPYDLETGRKQSPETVKNKLAECFDKIEKAAGSLGDKSHRRIAKARRVVPNMVATIAFFFDFVIRAIDDLHLVQPLQGLMLDVLMPACYLRLAARREKDRERKGRIEEIGEHLLADFRQRAGPFCSEPGVLEELEAKAWRLANVFQRASSCVEGRNAHLSRYHQGLHHLSDLKLGGLTVIHNYYIKRSDGTSAAERFFESRPKDLFRWLISHIQMPSRPRKQCIFLLLFLSANRNSKPVGVVWGIALIMIIELKDSGSHRVHIYLTI